jgi:hypothetical protein
MTDKRSDEEKFADVAFAIQADAARMTKELAANAATIAAQAAAIACAEGIHQQMTAELAAQAAEIERLLDGNTAMLSRNIDLAAELDSAKNEVEQACQARDVAERDRKSLAVIVETFQEMHWKLVDLFDPEMRGVSPLHYVEGQIAALRSQLEEQRKRLDGARKFVFNTPQGAIVIEPLCSKWRCYRDTMDWTAWENLIDHESNSMTFATLDKLFAALYAANWLAPHADTEST